jgi:hypothetical protein
MWAVSVGATVVTTPLLASTHVPGGSQVVLEASPGPMAICTHTHPHPHTHGGRRRGGHTGKATPKHNVPCAGVNTNTHTHTRSHTHSHTHTHKRAHAPRTRQHIRRAKCPPGWCRRPAPRGRTGWRGRTCTARRCRRCPWRTRRPARGSGSTWAESGPRRCRTLHQHTRQGQAAKGSKGDVRQLARHTRVHTGSRGAAPPG